MLWHSLGRQIGEVFLVDLAVFIYQGVDVYAHLFVLVGGQNVVEQMLRALRRKEAYLAVEL